MKEQPAWKRHGLERKRRFRERQEQILQHTESFPVNNSASRSQIPLSVGESQGSQASSLGQYFPSVGCSQTCPVSLGRNSAPHKASPASVPLWQWAEHPQHHGGLTQALSLGYKGGKGHRQTPSPE